MVKIKLVHGVPKWIQEEPSKAKKKLIKEQVYSYLENLVLTKGPLGKTKELIPDFISLLGKLDKEFKIIQQDHIKTTYKLVEAIYNELKNNARKIEKEIKAGKILPYSPPEPVTIPEKPEEKEPSQKPKPKSVDGAPDEKPESEQQQPSSVSSSDI